jgi:STE24 endopeptidase
MNEDKSARYHRLRRRLSIASMAWSALLLVALLVTGASASIRTAVSAFTASPALALLLYLAVLGVLHEPVSFALDFYDGYVLEHRYGFSRQSPSAWLRDHLKGLALGGVFALAAASLVYLTMRLWPGWWWLASGLVFAVLLVGLANLAPVLLLPLFFRFEPLDRPALSERLHRMAERAGARVMGVYRWHLGEKTSKANAALTGIGGTRRILLADTMLDQYSDDEIEVVLAHELAHHVHGDIWIGIAVEGVLMLTGFFAADVVLRIAGPLLGLQGLADPAGVPLLLLAAGAVSILLLPAMLALSRGHERRADRFALDLTSNPGAFTSAMKRLGAQNLAEDEPSPIVQWLFYSHPPLSQRLGAAAAWARAHGAAGGVPLVNQLD